MSSLLNTVKSRAEKPGVSATKPPNSSKASVCLVVCFPLFKALDISFVLRFSLGFILLIRVDLPAPLWPVKTQNLSLNVCSISVI